MNSCYFVMRLIYTYFQHAHLKLGTENKIKTKQKEVHRTFLINEKSLSGFTVCALYFVFDNQEK